MNITLSMIFKQLTKTDLRFATLIVFHAICYGLTYFYAITFGPTVIFSMVWTIGYLTAIRRFLNNPIDNFAAKHISYAQPNLYWINFAGRFIKNNIRFLFVSSIHLVMAVVPILSYKSFLDSSFIIAAIFILNTVLPITYLFVLRKLYLLWMQKNR